MVTTLSFTSDLPFGNEQAFDEFLGLNEIAHQTIGSFLQQKGFNITQFPLTHSPLDNPDWLLDHYTMHLNEGAALGLVVPDLSAVDLKDEGQFRDWMQAHAGLHDQENLALGIFT